jgi:hypothetical protein
MKLTLGWGTHWTGESAVTTLAFDHTFFSHTFRGAKLKNMPLPR